MSRHPHADRSGGGPGSSHQDGGDPSGLRRGNAETGQDKTRAHERNPSHSGVSGGGGEADRHHSHDPRGK